MGPFTNIQEMYGSALRKFMNIPISNPLLNLVSESVLLIFTDPACQSLQADRANYNTNMPPIRLMIFKKLFGDWSSKIKDAKMIGIQ